MWNRTNGGNFWVKWGLSRCPPLPLVYLLMLEETPYVFYKILLSRLVIGLFWPENGQGRFLTVFNRFRLVQSIPYFKHKSSPIPSRKIKKLASFKQYQSWQKKVVRSNFLYHSQDYANGVLQNSEPTRTPSCQYPPVCRKITRRKGLPLIFPWHLPFNG